MRMRGRTMMKYYRPGPWATILRLERSDSSVDISQRHCLSMMALVMRFMICGSAP